MPAPKYMGKIQNSCINRYRVDALHSDTYKIRGGLYRNTKDNEKEEGGKAEESVKKKNRVRINILVKPQLGRFRRRTHFR